MSWWDEPVVNDPAEMDEDDVHMEDTEPDGYTLDFQDFDADGSDWYEDGSEGHEDPGYIPEGEFEPEPAEDIQEAIGAEQPPDGAITLEGDFATQEDAEAAEDAVTPVQLDCDVQQGGASVDGEVVTRSSSLTYALAYTPDESGSASVTLTLPDGIAFSGTPTGATVSGQTATWADTATAGTEVTHTAAATVSASASGVLASACSLTLADEVVDGWKCEVTVNA